MVRTSPGPVREHETIAAGRGRAVEEPSNVRLAA